MRFQSMALILPAVLILVCGCACNVKSEQIKVDPAGQDSLGTQINDFAFRLFAKADKQDKNLFFSPYSISTAMGMVWGGAKGNTAAEISKTMAFTLPVQQEHEAFRNLQMNLNAIGSKGLAELSAANALFDAKRYKDLLLKEYSTLLQDYYYSDLYSLDFGDAKGSADFINKWVEEKTKNRIKDLVNEDHIKQSNDGMVLVNAIYFKGKWLKQFDPKNTIKDSFYTSGKVRDEETAKPVQMMSLRDEFPYAKLSGCQVLELPYSEQDLAMLVVLPDDIDKFKSGLDDSDLQKWQGSLKKSEVQVYLPSFKLDITLDGLTDILKNMGIKDGFNANLADFTGIRKPGGGADLYIPDVLHKAFIEVKEEGTEAAAATAVVMATKASPGYTDPTPVFRADHPFLYFIIHKPSNTMLFMGKLADPPALNN